MALLLLTVGLGLGSAQPLDLHPVVHQNFNLTKVAGDWSSISMASDDLTRIQPNGDLRLFVRTIKNFNNGSLKFDFKLRVHGECVTAAVVCERTRTGGVFTIAYEGHNTVRLLETDYELYITFYLQNTRNGTETRVLALYGRLPELSTPFLDRFKKICQKLGIGQENVISLTRQNDGC